MVFQDDCIIRYSDCYSDTIPLVLEAPPDVLDSILANEAHVKLDSSGIAFLASKKTAYKLRQQDNSNTQMVVFPKCESSEIMCAATGVVYAEEIFTNSIPDSDLALLFEKYADKGDILDHLVYNSIWSEDQILEHMQRSDFYYIDSGVWRRIKETDYFSLMDSILNACAVTRNCNSEEIWNMLNDCSPDMGYSLSLVQYLMSRLSESAKCVSNKGNEEWPLNIPLDPIKTAVHRGRHILWTSRRSFDLHEFMTQWKELLSVTVGIDDSVLDALSPLLSSTLEGLAIQCGSSIIFFDSRSLPVDLNGRVSELFKVLPSWPKEQLEGFIRPILPPGTKPDAVLLKICRLDENDYSSRF